jgi:predicted Fe-S protein YdhL (DUF1289 family)
MDKIQYIYTMSVASPCKLVCRYGKDDVCVGCYRTKEEITDWMLMNDDQKLTVWKNIRLRKNNKSITR